MKPINPNLMTPDAFLKMSEEAEGPRVAPPPGSVDMESLLRNPLKPPNSCDQAATLWLFGRNLDDICAEVLAHALARGDYRHIKYLALGNNFIGARGMCAIASAMDKGALPLLQHLGVQENPISDRGMEALCGVLDKSPKVQTLELYKCSFGTKGVQAMAAAAKRGALKELNRVYMRGNEAGDDGMAAICDAFVANALPRLESWNLQQNQIGDEGCLMLADTIEAGHLDKVRLIEMAQNVQTIDGFEVVTEVLKEYEKRMPRVHF